MNILARMKLGVKLVGGYTVVMLLMVVVSAVVYFGIQSLVQSSKWVNHTYEVMRTAESVQAAMIDMETGQRGFLIAGDDSYLEPFTKGQQQFDKLIAQGRQLTSDNPAQGERWQAVAALKARWLNEVALPEIEARRHVARGAAAIARFREVSSRTVGKEIFDSIRAALQTLEDKVDGNLRGEYLVTALTLDLVNMETGQRGFLLSGKEESLEPYVAGDASLREHLSALGDFAAGTAISRADIQLVEDRVDQWLVQAANPEIEARRAMNQHTKTIEDVIRMMETGQGKSLMDASRAKLQELLAAEEKLIGVRGAEQEETSGFAVAVALIGTLLAIVVGSLVAFLITRGILVPLRATNAMLKDIAEGEGDLTKRIPVNTRDEIGELGTNFNVFVEKLQGIIGDISNATTQAADAAVQLADITEKTGASLSNQKLETSQVATAMAEMTSTVQEVAGNAEQASSAAAEAERESKGGQAVVRRTAEAIGGLAQEIEDSAGVIEKLRGDSENIGTVLDVIKSIAEQTNLLALNAAIEAARAGEQGRGFAVVADEVRTLAQRTQQSTAEIEALIETLQGGANQAVEAMSLSRDRARDTVETAQNAGASLDSIGRAVDTIVQMNTQIAAAAEEQGAVAEEINHNVVRIQDMSEQTAAGAAETARASADLARLSDDLQGLVGQFKVR